MCLPVGRFLLCRSGQSGPPQIDNSFLSILAIDEDINVVALRDGDLPVSRLLLQQMLHEGLGMHRRGEAYE